MPRLYGPSQLEKPIDYPQRRPNLDSVGCFFFLLFEATWDPYWAFCQTARSFHFLVFLLEMRTRNPLRPRDRKSISADLSRPRWHSIRLVVLVPNILATCPIVNNSARGGKQLERWLLWICKSGDDLGHSSLSLWGVKVVLCSPSIQIANPGCCAHAQIPKSLFIPELVKTSSRLRYRLGQLKKWAILIYIFFLLFFFSQVKCSLTLLVG